MKILNERFPYRYVECGTLDNGFPDFRIQKADEYTKRYRDMYLCDNGMQLTLAMEDFEYTKWLDPEGVPCYVKNVKQSREDSKSVLVGMFHPGFQFYHKNWWRACEPKGGYGLLFDAYIPAVIT